MSTSQTATIAVTTTSICISLGRKKAHMSERRSTRTATRFYFWL